MAPMASKKRPPTGPTPTESDTPEATATPLTTGDVARRLGTTSTTVRRYVEAGRLPATRLPGGHYRIHSADLDTMLSQGRTSQVGL